MIKLSIITINYNNADGLEKTIKSVINQTFTNYEYIIIDGGSTDKSIAIIKSYSEQIKHWGSEKDRGIYHAMNKGIITAKGEYCLFLNSGDYLVNKSIIKNVFDLEKSQDILYGELEFTHRDTKKNIVKRPVKIDSYHMFHDNIWHPASFIKRELFNSIGLYNEQYKIAADYDFFLNALVIKKVSSVYIPFSISVYDTEGISSLPSNFQKVSMERNTIHHSYLTTNEICYMNNLRIIKNKKISKLLSNEPIINNLFNWLLGIYSKLTN
jgi:glycosyltransferase involved in cell wall biosynthesis